MAYEIHKNELGLVHREDGPAIIWPDGSEEWRINGDRHRLDGPAVVSSVGEEWFINGIRHREDGPAITREAYGKYWYVNGKLHRLDGPAIERSDGSKVWSLRGSVLSEEVWKKYVNDMLPQETRQLTL